MGAEALTHLGVERVELYRALADVATACMKAGQKEGMMFISAHAGGFRRWTSGIQETDEVPSSVLLTYVYVVPEACGTLCAACPCHLPLGTFADLSLSFVLDGGRVAAQPFPSFLSRACEDLTIFMGAS